jgi:hypothetical protein
MSSPSREHLLGYLLGALERTEQAQVEAELETNPHLRTELQNLEARLGRFGLTDAPEHYQSPPGLALRTCEYVRVRSVQATPASVGWSGSSGLDGQRRMTWLDFATTAAVLLIGATLFFPALSYSRVQAQIAACQNNLRQLGVALHEYSTHQPDHSFPRIEMAGNRAVAGAYAPQLVGNQLVVDPRLFWCPSAMTMRQSADIHIPTPEEVDALRGAELATMQQKMGGSYGYNMGFRRNGRLVPPSNAGRPNYALLSDAPSDDQPGRRSANHNGTGQNVLYEDGHVEFIRSIPCPQLKDDPFHNREGRVEAGLDCDDHVLGASADRPLPTPLPMTLINE